LDASDADIINTVVVKNDIVPEDPALLAWNNPATGNSGAITAIEKIVGADGRSCKSFETTVDTFSGISVYDGKTCELELGKWTMSELAPK